MTIAADVLHYLPLIVRTGISDWDRKFCVSIIGRMKRGAFTPSNAQARTIIRLVDDFRDRAMRDDAPLIEGAHDGGG